MVATLNWQLKNAPPELFAGARWPILTMMILHANVRNRAWPSMRRLAKQINKSLPHVTAAKQWLIEHGAVTLVPFEERIGEEKSLPGKQHVYQLTGVIKFGDVTIPYLYISPEQGEIEIDDQPHESLPPINDQRGESSMINCVDDQLHAALSIPSIDSSISNNTVAPASQDASDATPFPDAPKGFQWVASADSDQPLAHLTTGCITGPTQCKSKLYHRDFYRTWEKKNPRKPCLECLRVAEDKLKPKQPKPRKPDAVFDAIALGSFGMVKAPSGEGGRIGKLKNQVIECGMLPDDTPATLATDLADMYRWYKKAYPNLSAPAAVETICKYLAEYRQSRRVVADDTNVKFIEHDSYVAPSEVR